MHMSYRSKTYTWNDVILIKRSMIRVFFTVNIICDTVRRPAVAAGRHHMQDDGPSNGSEDGCVTTGGQLFGASRKTFVIVLL